jgi:hypothetical protein
LVVGADDIELIVIPAGMAEVRQASRELAPPAGIQIPRIVHINPFVVSLSNHEHNKVLLTRRLIFNVGSRTHGRDTFLCAGKEKYPKENCPMPLASCATRIYRGLSKGTSCPFDNVQHPCRTPYGLFPINASMLGTA